MRWTAPLQASLIVVRRIHRTDIRLLFGLRVFFWLRYLARGDQSPDHNSTNDERKDSQHATTLCQNTTPAT